MKQRLFPAEGQWYKGNLHTHTTLSDGVKSPEEMVAIYREAGYHFLALTDHDVYGIHADLCCGDFLVLPGIELNFDASDGTGYRQHHVVGIGLPGENTFAHGERFRYPDAPTAQDLVDALRARGNLAIYAHPVWSHTDIEVLQGLQGICGMEIYNHTCEAGTATGYADSYFDQLLWEGKRLWCFASDDSHQYLKDYGGGWICVKSPALTHGDILTAIQNGQFYASNGPEIHDITVEDGHVEMTCSPCRTVSCQSDAFPGMVWRSEEGDMTQVAFDLDDQPAYWRITCEDRQGHKAWSQPFWLP